MFPYFEILGIKFYMTGIWIIVFLICFILITNHFCKKRHQDFYKFFYWLPIAIIITYVSWAFSYHLFSSISSWLPIFPDTLKWYLEILSPYWYHFHFVWIIIGIIISWIIFFSKIKREENKRVRIDILFYATIISLIPLWLFLVFWDNFIWKPSTWFMSIKPLTTSSELNKLWSVYPVWIYLSFVSIIVLLVTLLLKKCTQKFGIWIVWFILLLIWLNIIFMYQQAPRYWVLARWKITFDIKQYISFFMIMLLAYLYYKRK